MSDKTKDILRKKMAPYEETAPQGLFDDVMAEMERRHRRKLIPLAAATLLGAAAAIGLLLMNVATTTPNVEEIGNHVLSGKAIATNISREESKDNMSPSKDNASEPILLAEAVGATRQSQRAERMSGESDAVHEQNSLGESSHVSEETSHEASEKTSRQTSEETTPTASYSSHEYEPHNHHFNRNLRKNSSRGVSFGLSINGNAVGNLGKQNVLEAAYMSDSGYKEFDNEDFSTSSPITIKNVEHRQPVKVGLSVSYPLSSRWSLETGAFYSYHTSDIDYSDGSNSVQHLHYVGVPLSVRYKIWHNRRWSIYGSAGTAVEKMVSGKQKHAFTSTDVTIKALQWSVSAHGGAEFHLNSAMGIYVEPGVGYYFDNHPTVPTFYSDHPWNLELRLGLRFHAASTIK